VYGEDIAMGYAASKADLAMTFHGQDVFRKMIASYENHRNLRLLTDGQESFKRIIQQIGQAEKSVHINMFIWRDDKIGNHIGRELLAAADRGVKVSISKDKLGSVFEKAEENRQSFFHRDFDVRLWLKQKVINSLYPTLGEAASCKQEPNDLVNPILAHKNIHIDKDKIKGDHSKYFIFDDQVLIIGGMNIETKAVHHDVSGTKWDDYMIEITGEGFVNRLKQELSGAKQHDTDSWLEFVFNTKDKIRQFEIKPKVLELLSAAKKTVYIQMAYFGDLDVTSKIVEIANAGIEVTILLPKRANLQTDLNHKVMKRILTKTNGSADIYFCRNMLHAKMIYVDEKIILIGSANLNKQTMEQLSELDVLVHGENLPFVDLIRKSTKHRMSNSERVSDVAEIKFNRFKAFLESLVCS
jgi:cardiolipin synthase